MNNLENEVKALIIEALNLEDMTPEAVSYTHLTLPTNSLV